MKFLNTPLSDVASLIITLILGLIVLIALTIIDPIGSWSDGDDADPLRVGRHRGYDVICTNNYRYKIIRYRKSIESIQIMNSDGTPATCDMPVY